MVRRFFLVLILSISYLVSAKVDIDASLSGILEVSENSSGNFSSSGVAKGELTVKSTGSKYVKSQLTLDFISIRNTGLVSITKAWVKFRYPVLRATIGKNRITWGEGIAFNAGDVIFDDYISPNESSTEAMDLTADELRSKNRTMALVSFPMGKFTFTEAIYLPYDFFTTEELGAASTGLIPEDKEPYQHSYGGRFVSKLMGVKVESGYLYNGYISTHKPYVSFNGTLGLDYHLSSSINIKHGDTGFDLWKSSLKLSLGLFYLFELENDKTLTLRSEAMLKPYGEYESCADEGKQKLYGVLIYPEIVFVPNSEVSLFVRSIVSPIDISSKVTLGLNWKTYQGFSIGSYIAFNIGDKRDLYPSEDSLSFTVVVKHKF